MKKNKIWQQKQKRLGKPKNLDTKQDIPTVAVYAEEEGLICENLVFADCALENMLTAVRSPVLERQAGKIKI